MAAWKLTAGLLCAALAAAPGHAQMPAEIAAKIAAIGPVWNVEVLKQTIELYRPALKDTARTGATFVTDIAYGADERQKLDLAHPAAGGRGLPVIIFVPGGGFASSNRNVAGLCCHNILAFFAARGVVAIAASYRVAPAHAWPAGAQDVGSAVAWARANAARYGGDPSRIFVFGNSAGANHVATYLFDASVQPKEGPGVAGAILMSGASYRVLRTELSPMGLAYFGQDEGRYAERSSAAHVTHSKPVPVFLVYAQYDPPPLAAPTLEVAQALCQRDQRCPDIFYLRGHNHLSPSLSFNTRDEELGVRVLGFLQAVR